MPGEKPSVALWPFCGFVVSRSVFAKPQSAARTAARMSLAHRLFTDLDPTGLWSLRAATTCRHGQPPSIARAPPINGAAFA